MTEVTVRANALLQEATRTSLDQIGATMRELGLTGYATEAFCALARAGEATAGDLVVRTGIPDSKIYYALSELVEKGLVEVQVGKPKMYRAVAPRQVETRLRRILEARYERERTAVSRVGSLLEPIQSATKSTTTDLAYIVKGESNVLARARNMVASARREILLIASHEPFVRKLEEGLVKAATRGIGMRLALPNMELEKDLERRAEIRPIVCSGCVLVVDREQILTVNETMDGSIYGITSTDEMLVRLGLDYWESPRCCAVGG